MDKLLQEVNYHLTFRKRYFPKEKLLVRIGDRKFNEGLDTAYEVFKCILQELDRTGDYPKHV